MVKRQVIMYSFNEKEDSVIGRHMNIDVRKYYKMFDTEDLEIAYQGFRENYRMCDLPCYFHISNNCIRKFLDGVKKSNIDHSLYYYPHTQMIRGDKDNIGTNKIKIELYSTKVEAMDSFIKSGDLMTSCATIMNVLPLLTM